MAEIVCGILKDHNKAKQMGNAAQLIAYRHRGALEKTISIINSEIS
jgi:hypothetical protein